MSYNYTGRNNHSIRIVAIIIPAVLILILAILFFVGNFFYNFALNPNNPKGFNFGVDVPTNDATRWLQSDGQQITMTSRDGLVLNAHQVRQAEGHKYAIVCHGYQSSAMHTASFGKHFYDLGYSVLLPDARGHGSSEGDYIGMGWPERHDVVDWISTIVQADPQAEIALFGISMGAATVMMVSGEALPANVKCIIEDCGYSSVWDEFTVQLKAKHRLPPVPILNFSSLVTKLRAGYFFEEASAVKQVAKSSTPTLFIHGEEDSFVPFWMMDVVYNAATCEKERLAIPGAAHGLSSKVDPILYWGSVDNFLARYIP